MSWKPPYSVTSAPKNNPGSWASHKVTVLENGHPIGSYVYNHYMKPPFFPFELDGRWYALYSKDYTACSVMRLPDCTDVWSEQPDQVGFCPVEFWVPSYQWTAPTVPGRNGNLTTRPDTYGPAGANDQPAAGRRHPVRYLPFGFVSGCIWGDDTSWKIQFLDFARINEGIVVHDDRFGYREMHPDLKLADSVRITDGIDPLTGMLDPARLAITLTHTVDYRVDGRRIDVEEDEPEQDHGAPTPT